MASTAMVMMRAVMAHDALLDNDAVSVHPGRQRGNGKEDGVHNGKRPRGLEHGARLADGPRVARDADVVDVVVPDAVDGRVLAVGVLDLAQVDDAGDEAAEEAEVDKGDEHSVVGGSRVVEQREEGPGEGEDGDDEEDEDVVGREDVCVVELFDEPAEHANWRYLERMSIEAQKSGDLSLPE